MLTLPTDLAQEFWQEYSSFEESKQMQYVTSVERIGIEKGTRKGLLQGIDTCLQLKFNTMHQELLEEIYQIQDNEQLETILAALKTVNTVEELKQIYQKNPE